MVTMAKILLVLAARIENRAQFVTLLDAFEQEGYTVHLFEDKEISNFELDTLDSAMGYLHHHYQEIESISVMSNIKTLLFAWYQMQYFAVEEYILYVDSEWKEYNFGNRVAALNDFSDFSIVAELKPIQIIFEDWDHIIPLVINYLMYISLYEKERSLSLPRPNISQEWEDVLGSKLVQDLICYLTRKYELPVSILMAIFIPFAYHTLKNFEIVHCLFQNIIEKYTQLDLLLKEKAIAYLEGLFPQFILKSQICLSSLLFKLSNNKKHILKMFDETVYHQLSIHEKSSIFWTIKSLLFVGKLEFTIDEVISYRRFYQHCVDEVINMVELPKVESQELRNKDRVVIITSQFLGIEHAPTRNVLDYARNLRKMGKEVFIINSADILKESSLPLCEMFKANFSEAYNTIDYIEFENERYKFYQAKLNMPDLQEIQHIVNLVNDYNPEFVISVSDTTLTADVCSCFTTVVTVPCGGILPMYAGSCWAIPRKPLPSDQEIFNAFNIKSERVFPIHYTFMRKEKKNHLIRSDLHLPNNAFIICIVGNRLDVEVTQEFIQQIEQILRGVPTAYILFIGGYHSYEKVMLQHSLLKERSSCTGHRSDIQSVYTLCNAYLNPLRQGGATSGAEAMMEGLPIITRPHGDVYYQLWLEQSFDKTEEMIVFLQKCIADPQFYLDQRNHARLLGDKLFDTAGMMQELLSYTENYLSNNP